MKDTNEILDELWLAIKNMTGLEQEWDDLIECKDGAYLDREDVLDVIDKVKKEVSNGKSKRKGI